MEKIRVRPNDKGVNEFAQKAMRMVFKGHLQEFKEIWSYPKSGKGAFSARTPQNPV